jgi:hypothetical protein
METGRKLGVGKAQYPSPNAQDDSYKKNMYLGIDHVDLTGAWCPPIFFLYSVCVTWCEVLNKQVRTINAPAGYMA